MNSNFSDVRVLAERIGNGLICNGGDEVTLRRLAQIVKFIKGKATTVELTESEKAELLQQGEDILKNLNAEFCRTEEGREFLNRLIEELKNNLLHWARNAEHMGWPFLSYYRIVEAMKILELEMKQEFAPQIKLCYFISMSFPEEMSLEERKREINAWNDCKFKGFR